MHYSSNATFRLISGSSGFFAMPLNSTAKAPGRSKVRLVEGRDMSHLSSFYVAAKIRRTLYNPLHRDASQEQDF